MYDQFSFSIRYLFVLFSDLLIYCSETAGKLILHQQIILDKYFNVVKVDNNKKYNNCCFEIHSTVKSFLVYCENENDRDDWLEDISKELTRMYPQRRPSSTNSDDRVLVNAPIWIPDDFSESCMIASCQNPLFTFTRRRHHCRYCGKLICSECSKNKLPHFTKGKNEFMRVCSLCFEQYKVCFPDLEEILSKQKSTKSAHRQSSLADDELSDDEIESSEKSITTPKYPGLLNRTSISQFNNHNNSANNNNNSNNNYNDDSNNNNNNNNNKLKKKTDHTYSNSVTAISSISEIDFDRNISSPLSASSGQQSGNTKTFFASTSKHE